MNKQAFRNNVFPNLGSAYRLISTSDKLDTGNDIGNKVFFSHGCVFRYIQCFLCDWMCTNNNITGKNSRKKKDKKKYLLKTLRKNYD